MQLKWRPQLVVARSKPGYVEITRPGFNKAAGLKIAALKVGLDMSNLVVCGGGENDIEMLSNLAYGIALGHAPHELHAAAAELVGSNDDSLAAALSQVFAK